jgi:hypothetical protein
MVFQSFHFGHVSVDIGDGYTVTTLADGSKVPAQHAEQPGQAELAAAHGYDSATELNRDHDLAHSLLSHMIGLEASPTLAGVAAGKHFKYWQVEEAAVLALQAFCKVAGVDLMELARRYSK